MNRRLKLVLTTSLAAMLLTAVIVSSAFAQGTAPYGWRGDGMMGGSTMGGWRSSQPAAPGAGTAPYSGYGPGMRGEWRNDQPMTPAIPITGTAPYYGGYGPGMTPTPGGAAAGVGGWGNGQPNAQTGQAPYGGYDYGRGGMGSYGHGMMGGYGPGMMGWWGAPRR